MDHPYNFLLPYGPQNGPGPPLQIPNLQSLANYDQAMLPRFLFRAYSPGSMGYNLPNNFASAEQKEISLYDPTVRLQLQYQDPLKFLEFIRKHITWARFDSPFISLTDSLLLCLAWAYIMNNDTKMRKRHGEHIKIEIIDTRRIALGTILPATLLSKLVAMSKMHQYEDRGSFDQEYLAFSALRGNFSTVPYRSIAYSLESYLPQLRDVLSGSNWGMQLKELRGMLFDPQILNNPGLRQDTRQHIQDLAHGLSAQAPENRVPLFIYVLATRLGSKSGGSASHNLVLSSHSLAELINTFGITRNTPSTSGLVLLDFAIPSWLSGSRAPEHREATELAKAVCKELKEEQRRK